MSKALIKRFCIVEVTLDPLYCDRPTTAVLAADKILDYDILLRQLSPDENVVSVEWTGKFAGAEVDMITDESPTQYYEFEEDDISEIKDMLGRF